MNRAVEKYYTVAEVALLLSLHPNTVRERIKARDFGDGVIDLGTEASSDFRIPASGVNFFVDSRRIFSAEILPIAARNESELRRKWRAA